MPDYKSLLEQIKRGEDRTQDFKLHITSPNKIARTIVSFANSDGGTILVGVSDKGEIIGVDVSQEKYMLIKAAKYFCDPPVFLHFNELNARGVQVLAVDIKKSKNKDHRAKDQQGNWLPYTRIKDQSVIMKGYEKQMLADKHNLDPIPILMEKNKGLINYLEEHDSISIKDYMKMMNISYSIAERSLSELTQSGILTPAEINHRLFYFLAKD